MTRCSSSTERLATELDGKGIVPLGFTDEMGVIFPLNFGHSFSCQHFTILSHVFALLKQEAVASAKRKHSNKVSSFAFTKRKSLDDCFLHPFLVMVRDAFDLGPSDEGQITFSGLQDGNVHGRSDLMIETDSFTLRCKQGIVSRASA